MSKIKIGAVFSSSIPSILIFILIDSALEHLCFAITGISVVHTLEQKMQMSFDTKIHMVNLALFSFEMFSVVAFYALIRPALQHSIKAKSITITFFLLLFSLFIGQMVNFGIYPLKTAIVLLLSTIVSFSVSVFAGTFIYDLITKRDESTDTSLGSV